MDAKLKITVVGLSPLLTHNPQSMASTRGPSKAGNIPSPEDEAEAGTYRNEDGNCCVPGIAFRGSILGAAGAWKAKRSSMKSHLSHAQVEEELVPLLTHDGIPIKSYEIDRRRAIVVKAGIIRSRPKFTDWSASFTLIYDDELIRDTEIIFNIITDAGKRIGIGDYRPARSGWFGRYALRR